MPRGRSIALLHTTSPERRIALNKDLNGGLGTADDYGPTLMGRFLSRLKWQHVRIPVISFAFSQAILRQQGHAVAYFEDAMPTDDFDIAFVRGSIVDFRNENRLVAKLKAQFPSARVGVFGEFPSRFADRYPDADFVVDGELEGLLSKPDWIRAVESEARPRADIVDYDALPTPDYTGFPIERYSYSPMLSKRPFATLVSSKGCPYPCGFYCAYGEYQGKKVRQRSAAKVYADMRRLNECFGVRAIQFRDPTFGLDRKFALELCDMLTLAPLPIEWGMETNLDRLTVEQLDRYHAAGLRSINIGLETDDESVAKANKRKLTAARHEDVILAHARGLGIRINAFFILGYDTDTAQGLKRIRRYARKSAPNAARFCVNTPYPGTGFFNQLTQQGRIVEHDWERYTQFNLVYDHPNLTAEQVNRGLVRAYLGFYLHPARILRSMMSVARSRLAPRGRSCANAPWYRRVIKRRRVTSPAH